MVAFLSQIAATAVRSVDQECARSSLEMFDSRTIRRNRPIRIVIAVIAGLFVWSAIARSRSMHVSDVNGRRNGNTYTIRCRVINPRPRDSRATLTFSVSASVPGTDYAVYETLAEKQLDMSLNAKEERDVKVTLNCPRDRLDLRPEVLIRMHKDKNVSVDTP